MPETTIVQDHSKNFDTLVDAVKSGHACIMECTLKATGEKVAVVCAVNIDDETEEYNMVPMAMFFNGNPYELLIPPMEVSD